MRPLNRMGLQNAWLNPRMCLRAYWDFHRFSQAARKPQKTQRELLRRILLANAQTAFGCEHGFASIDSYEAFAAQVPIQNFEDLRPFIDRQIALAEPVHTHELPMFYNLTSGTTGRPKRIPVLKKTVLDYQRGQRIAAHAQLCGIPGIFSGKILAIVSPAVEGHLDDGTPYGAMSGVLHASLPESLRSRYVLPQQIYEIEDYESRYLLIAALAAAETDISVQASANPSTFIRLQEIINLHAGKIIEFVRTGRVETLSLDVQDTVVRNILSHITANPVRADNLRRCRRENGALTFADLWPGLKAVVTWTGGNCAALLPALRSFLPPLASIVEMGYICSEFRGSINVDCRRNLCAPTLDEVFFEFIEKDDWESGVRVARTVEQLESGKVYYLLATTQNGLYRYFINDLVEVTGRFHNTPTIRFVQKGNGVTNLSGEKLYECQLIEAVSQSCRRLSIVPRFYLLLASRDDFLYTLLFDAVESRQQEELAHEVNQSLFDLNQEFRDKVRSGRIRPVSVKRVRPGMYEAYKAHLVKGGRREGQFKMGRLQYQDECAFPFEVYLA